MREEVTIQIDAYDHVSGGKAITAHFSNAVLNQIGPAVLPGVVNAISDRIVAEWWKTHSAAVLEQLAPGLLAATLRTKLENLIATKVLGEETKK